jgi:hypothetical protein
MSKLLECCLRGRTVFEKALTVLPAGFNLREAQKMLRRFDAGAPVGKVRSQNANGVLKRTHFSNHLMAAQARARYS